MKKTPEQARDLAAAPYNPRHLSAARGASLSKAMEKFGDLGGIVYNVRTKRLIGGHQRIKYLQPNARIRKAPAHDDVGTVAIGTIVSGKASWAYREVDWDETTEKAANIAANAAGGAFDELALGSLVLELDRSGLDLELLNLDNLEDILGAAHKEAERAEDEGGGAAKKPTSKRGQIWILAEHRLMCGDSTSQDDVERLMGNEAAALVFTDPPYGVSYEARSGDFAVIEGDAKRDDALYRLVGGALKQASKFTTQTAAFYIWHASSTRREFEDALRDANLVERQYLIWVKHSIVLGYSDYRWAHEPCFYASKAGQKPAWHGDKAQPTVWRATLRRKGASATTLGQILLLTDGAGGQVVMTPKAPKGKKVRTARLKPGETIAVETGSHSSTVLEVVRDFDYVHPTQKPVELARIAINNSSRAGDIVMDLFGGSGTTLIGAEMTGRRARLMEIDPAYVDAIIKRWEEFTGKKAVRAP